MDLASLIRQVPTTDQNFNLNPNSFDFGKPESHDDVLRLTLDQVCENYAPVHKTRRVPRNIADKDIHDDYVDLHKITVQMDESSLAYVKDQVSWLRPTYQPRGPHDHPVSHYLTEVNESFVVSKFGKQKFIDLFGNPRRQLRFARNFRAYTVKSVAKDYIRDFADIPNTNQFTSMSDMVYANQNVKHVLCTHALYYLTVDQIGELLCTGELAGKRRLHAIVHRHANASGTLNNGELEYKYIDADTVTQWSRASGEGYTHPTVEPYFHQSSVMTPYGAIAWTTNKLAGDSFSIEFVGALGFKGAPSALATLSQRREKEAVTIAGNSTYQVRQFWGRSWIQYAGPAGPIELEDAELFDILRRYVAGRSRDAQTKKDLTLLCRRLCDKRDIFAKYTSEHNVDPSMIMAYVEAAFHADLDDEISLMVSFRRNNCSKLKEHARLMENPEAMDNSWHNTVSSAADVAIKTGSTIIKSFPAAPVGVVETAADLVVSNAMLPIDVVNRQVPKFRPGVASALTQDLTSVVKNRVSRVIDSLTDKSYVREAVTTHELLDHMTATKRFEPRITYPSPPSTPPDASSSKLTARHRKPTG